MSTIWHVNWRIKTVKKPFSTIHQRATSNLACKNINFNLMWKVKRGLKEKEDVMTAATFNELLKNKNLKSADWECRKKS